MRVRAHSRPYAVLALLLGCLPSGAGRAGEDRLSLNFQNMDLRAALYALAQVGERDMVIADSVKGQISLRLHNVSWKRALAIILQARGLEERAIGQTLHISRREDWLAEDRQRFESGLARRKLQATRLVPLTLRHRQATDMRKLLEEGRLLSENGTVLVDTASNTLFVNDNETQLDKIRHVLELADKPARQVLIEARIVEAADNFSRELGSKLSFAIQRPHVSLDLAHGRAGSDTALDGVDMPLARQSGTIATLFKPNAGTLIGLELRAMQATDQGQVLSNPRLLTADRTEASIEEGSEIPYTQSNSRGTPSTIFKKAALGLRIKPIISPDDDSIWIEVEISKDSPNYARQHLGAPSVDTKKIKTMVRVANGGTVVLGGIYIEELRSNRRGIPILSDLPFIGPLFGSRHNGKNRRELLVFITPQIIS